MAITSTSAGPTLVEIEGEYDPEFAKTIQQQIDLGVRSLEQNQPDMAITFFRSARAKVTADFPFFDHLVHNELLALKQRIEQLLAQGRTDESLDLLDEALKLDLGGNVASEASVISSFADHFHNLGLVFFENLQFEACIRCTRRAIAIHPSQIYYVNLTNALSVLKQPLLLSDLSPHLTEADIANHIFIACVPKSASTFLKNVLVGLTGYRELFGVFAAGQNEHDLYMPSMIELADVNTVSQQHCRASEANIMLMQALGIQPVVLVRNIFDAIISQLDFYRNGAYFNSYFRSHFLELDEATQIDLLIDNLTPWYLQFVASWQLAEKERRLEVMWLTYEELTSDKQTSIQKVLEFSGLGAPGKDIQKVISQTEAEARRNRFNKGVAGRGAKTLTENQKSRIILLTKYYPNTDFGLIGL